MGRSISRLEPDPKAYLVFFGVCLGVAGFWFVFIKGLIDVFEQCEGLFQKAMELL